MVMSLSIYVVNFSCNFRCLYDCVLCIKLEMEVLICLEMEILLLEVQYVECDLVKLDVEDDCKRFFCEVGFVLKFKFIILISFLIWFCIIFEFDGVEDNVVVDKFMDFGVVVFLINVVIYGLNEFIFF